MDDLIEDGDPLARILDEFSGESGDAPKEVEVSPIPLELLDILRGLDNQIIEIRRRMDDVMRSYLIGKGISIAWRNANFDLIVGILTVSPVGTRNVEE